MSALGPPGGETTTYRFGPRDPHGLVMGLRTGQVLVIAASLGIGVALVRALGGPIGSFGLLCSVVAGVALSLLPVAGRTAEQWAPVLARYAAGRIAGGAGSAIAARGALGRTSSRADARGRAPRLFRGFGVTSLEIEGQHLGAVHDRRAGTLTVVLAVEGPAFSLLGELDRERRVAAWSDVLAAAAHDARALYRLQWVERTLPDACDLLARPLGAGIADHRSVLAYAELCEATGAGLLRHDVLLACTLRESVSSSTLRSELRGLVRHLREAGLLVDGPLSGAGLRMVLRESFEVKPLRHAVSWPWPIALRERWSEVVVDGLVHATYWVAEWPRVDVRSDFLLPILAGLDGRRTVSVVMAPVPPERAQRRAEHARTARVADDQLRVRHGFALTARRRREQEAVERREQELAFGHVGFRFSGYVSVAAPDAVQLAESCGRLEQAAALARLDLRRLYGAQAEALLTCLPLGRGCR